MGVRNARRQELRRLEAKSLDARFLPEIQQGLSCSPFEAEAVLQVAPLTPCRRFSIGSNPRNGSAARPSASPSKPELLNRPDTQIASLLAAHERESQKLIPRRATLHDFGSGLTHKAIICRKHCEGKTADQIARETHHSLSAVDCYLKDFARVRHCRQLGMSPEQIAFTLNHSLHLVQQYLDLDQELQPVVKERESNNG